jgi:hypothetical protein
MMFIRLAMKSLVFGFFMAGLLLVPFLGPFTVGLLLIPLGLVPFEFVRRCCQTGDQVEIGFGWVRLHSFQPFFIYWAYYACVVFVYLSLRKFCRRSAGA